MTTNIVIVAHPTRTTWAQQLANQTSAQHINYDTQHLGCTRNHIQAWQWHQQHTTTDWAVVLEDDAQPIPEFTTQLNQALAAAPAGIVSLYLGRQRPPQHQQAIATALLDAGTRNHAWIITTRLYHAVATAIQTKHITPLLLHLTHSRLDIDEAITQWARQHTPIAYTNPSLVDHRDGPSIAKHRDSAPRTTGRTAWQTGTRTQWATPATTI